MEREHQTEWLGLRTEAGEILRKGFPEKPRDRRVFQLVVLPSFEESYSWELYERETGSDTVEAIALKAVWHLREDLSKFDPLARLKHPRKLSPTITVKAGRIDGALAAELIGELAEIAVTLGPCNDGISLDGTSYELTVGTGSTQSRLAWHNDGPPYWNAVRRWTLRIVSKLEDALQTCNS